MKKTPLIRSSISPSDCLNEAILLAKSLNIDVIDSDIVKIHKPNVGTLINKGRLEDLKHKINEFSIDLIIIDSKLSPIQQRNLEKYLKIKVIDRTRLILDIFEKRAETREGVLQVELAQLDYQKTRLVRSWTHLERQRGSLSFIGGPGESQLEIDKRLINDQIIKIKKKLKDHKNTRRLHRDQRSKKPYFIIALVGYTNAGKSTLFNKLTGEGVLSKDMLFATLDTKMKRLKTSSSNNIIISDTVGFISELPTELIMAFRSTLEEVLYADIILNVRDISSKYTNEQNNDVIKTIKELGKEVTNKNYIEVLNKIDLLDLNEKETVRVNKSNNQVLVSSISGEGESDLIELINHKINIENETHNLRIPYQNSSLVSWLHENSNVLQKKYRDKYVELKVQISKKNHTKLLSLLTK